MTTDLPPDVRELAARAAFEHTTRINPYPSWDDLPEEWREIQRGEADAVAEVLAKHWARSFGLLDLTDVEAERNEARARVAELEAENERLRRTSIVDNAYAGPEIKVEFDDA